jgi:hypothetical protein
MCDVDSVEAHRIYVRVNHTSYNYDTRVSS